MQLAFSTNCDHVLSAFMGGNKSALRVCIPEQLWVDVRDMKQIDCGKTFSISMLHKLLKFYGSH